MATSNKIRNKKKFIMDYFNPNMTKIYIIEKYEFSGYQSLSIYVSKNDIHINIRCKVCGLEIKVDTTDKYKDLENGTVCERHKNYSMCADCNLIWINDKTHNKCSKCAEKYEKEKKSSFQLWKERESIIWNNNKDNISVEMTEILRFIYNNKATLANKLDKMIISYEMYGEYSASEACFDELMNKELIRKYENKYIVLSQIAEKLNSNQDESLYKKTEKKEDQIFSLLKENFKDLKIVRQYSPEWLGLLRIDFYSEKYKFGIEWHGEQHYFPVEIYGGEAQFNVQQKRDNKKRELCAKNGITLIELKYDLKDNEILNIIRNEISRKTVKSNA